MAERLGMSIDELFAKHTERQLSLWIAHLLNEEEETTRDQWYLMQIAAEVRRWKVKNPRSVTLEDFHLFQPDDVREVEKESPSLTTSSPLTEAQREARVNRSKVYWGMVLARPPSPVPPPSVQGRSTPPPPPSSRRRR